MESSIFLNTLPTSSSVVDLLKEGDGSNGFASADHGMLSSSDRDEHAGEDTNFRC